MVVLIIGIFALCAFVFVGGVEGETYYVDDDAGEGGNGTEDNPFETIQEAIDAADDGDILYILQGTYNERIDTNKSLTIEGEDRNGTYIDMLFFEESDQNILFNFTMEHVTFEKDSHDNVISNCSFIGDGYEAIELRGSNRNRINNCSMNTTGYYGFVMRESQGNLVENCSIMNHGILLGGESIQDYITNDFHNNTVNGKDLVVLKNYTSFSFQNPVGQLIVANCSDGEISRLNISNTDTGVHIAYSKNITIRDSVITNCNSNGLRLEASDNCSVVNCTLSSNGDGMMLVHTNDSMISTCTFTRNQWGDGGVALYLAYSSRNNISDCIITDHHGKFATGIMIIFSSTWNIVSNCTIRNNSIDQGIFISQESNHNLINNCTISGNDVGVKIRSSSWNNSVHNCSITDTLEYGMNAEGNGNVVNATDNWWGHNSGPYHPQNNSNGKGENVTDYIEFDPWIGMKNVTGNTLYVDDDAGEGGDGTEDNPFNSIQEAIDAAEEGDRVEVREGQYNEAIFINKTLQINGENKSTTVINSRDIRDAVTLNSGNVSISNFTLKSASLNGGTGVYIASDFNKIYDNTFSDSKYGISSRNSENNTIENNLFVNCSTGVEILRTNSTTVIGNSFNSTIHAAIAIAWSENITVSENSMIDCGLVLVGKTLRQWNSHSISTTNTVNGNPVYYLTNSQNIKVPADAGQVILSNCSDVKVEDLSCTNGSTALQVGYSNKIFIANNSFHSNNYHGIYLRKANNCTIMNNNCSNNYYQGIYFTTSHNNTLSNNSCSFVNDIYDGFGIYFINSRYNQIRDNNCSNNRYGGIKLLESDWNVVINTICNGNLITGLSLYESNHNSIINIATINNLIDNIRIDNSCNNSVSNSTTTGSGVGIILKYNSHDNELYNNSISHNDDGIYLYGRENTHSYCFRNIAHQNDIFDNIQGIDGSENGEYFIDATKNWWGHDTGPYHEDDNPDGEGDEVTDYVLFDPWVGKPISTYYVDDDAAEGGTGSQERPFDTIQKAIDAAENWDTIFVFNGTYTETIILLFFHLDLIGNGSDSTIIDGGGESTVVNISGNYVNFSGFKIINSGSGTWDAAIKVEGNFNNIHNNTCTQSQVGIRLYPSADACEVRDNDCSGNDGWGIFIHGCKGNKISYNNCSNNKEHGIFLRDCLYNTIENNTISRNGESGNGNGIHVKFSSNFNEIHFNNIFRNEGYGIKVEDNLSNPINATFNWWGDASGPYHPTENPWGTGNRVSDYVTFDPWLGKPPTLYVDDDAPEGGNGTEDNPFNTIQEAIDAANEGDTIRVWDGEYTEALLLNKTLQLIGNGSSTTSIKLDGSTPSLTINADNATISGFLFTTRFINHPGILLTANRTTIHNNRFYKCSPAIEIPKYADNHGHSNFIHNNTFLDNGNGIVIYYSKFNAIVDNEFGNEQQGLISESIIILFSERDRVENNSIISSGLAISLLWCEKSEIIGNYIESETHEGIEIKYSYSCILEENQMVNCSIQLFLTNQVTAPWTSNNIAASNTVNGNPVRYIINNSGNIDLSNAGQIILVNCSDMQIDGLEFSNVTVGITIGVCERIVVSNYSFSDSYYGIDIWVSKDCSIENSSFTRVSTGIAVYWSQKILINFNSFSYCSREAIYVQHLSSSQIFRNSAGRGMDKFLFITISTTTVIKENDIIESEFYAIEIHHSSQIRLIQNIIGWGSLGISLLESSEITFVENQLSTGGIKFQGQELAYWNTHTMRENTINNTFITYLKNQTMVEIVDQIGPYILANCTNITIRNLTGLEGSFGIDLGFCEDIEIIGSKFHDLLGHGILMSNSKRFDIRDCSFEALFPLEGMGISLYRTNNGTIYNSSNEGLGYGFYIYYGDNITITHSTMHDSDYGVYAQQDLRGIYLRNNSFIGNIKQGIYTWSSNGEDIDARYNWWGSHTGPFHPLENPDGLGDNVEDNIMFTPWLTHHPWKSMTFYVDDDAEEGGDGNLARPFREIQDAIDAARAGDIVRVWDGEYYEMIEIRKTISLVGNSSLTTLIEGSGEWDVILITANNVTISGFSVIGPDSQDSLILINSDNCHIYDNNFSHAGYFGSTRGITTAGRFSLIENNTFTNFRYGVYSGGLSIDDGDKSIIVNNTFYSNFYGIYVSRADFNYIGYNHFLNNNESINSRGADFTIIEGNEIHSSTKFGIELFEGSMNTISNNTLSDNREGGMYLLYTYFATLTNNSMTNDGIRLLGHSDIRTWTSHSIDMTNQLNDRPIYYYKNMADVTVPNDGGQLILANCSGMIVKDCSYNNASNGITLGFSENNTIENTTISDISYYGIVIHSCSHNNSFIGNIISNCSIHGVNSNGQNGESWGNEFINNQISSCGVTGIHFRDSYEGIFIGNVFRNNAYYGLMVYVSSGNIVENNEFYNNFNGINMKQSYSSIYLNNTCSNNSNAGMAFKGSTDNTIQNNTLSYNRYGMIQDEWHIPSTGNIFQFNRIMNNTLYGIEAYNRSGSNLDARYNYWGHSSGPHHPVNNSVGLGDNVSDFVIFDPWIGEEETPEGHYLCGYVIDQYGEPIEGVLVRYIGHDPIREDISNKSGYYCLMDIGFPFCCRNITVSKIGHETFSIELSPGISYYNFTLYRITEFYVDDDAEEGGDGTLARPFLRIQDAIDAAEEGGSIYVLPGTYYENITIDKLVNVQGADMETTIIEGGDEVDVVYISADQVSFSGFTLISHSTQSAFRDYCVEINANSTFIHDVVCHTEKGGIYLRNANYNTISNVTCTGAEYGIRLSESSYNRMEYCNLSSNGYGLIISGSEAQYSNYIGNNTIIGNNFVGIRMA